MLLPKILSLLGLSALLTAVGSVPVAVDNGNADPMGYSGPAGTLHTSDTGIQYLLLNDDFPADHPALNMTYVASEIAAGRPAPKLPGVPAPTFVAPQPPGVLHCETTEGSPHWMDVWKVSQTLWHFAKYNPGWCCNNPPGPCKQLVVEQTAASDICAWTPKKMCIDCVYAADAVFKIATQCTLASKAGGFVRYGGLADINAYHS
ncbi:hypothetical protein FN846DRAFT_984935 [Sphaerosporella brunnea]|uniref:LysM domain-containing protein n=1 Tax=Sphaerosporella brunnea TaxID=1250544 RepID=A0A5J5EVR6_9PEZI|nr:hypothetical protein FN846DRAFT_984935 [Sphaerosporella brunnea]